jgi:type II secretory pathway pseudopilin PulG
MIRRSGSTMLELIVVLVILGIMASVVGLAMGAANRPGNESTIAVAHGAIAEARRVAIARGSPVVVAVPVDAREYGDESGGASSTILRATAFPDGSVIADSALGIDRMSGKPRRERDHE